MASTHTITNPYKKLSLLLFLGSNFFVGYHILFLISTIISKSKGVLSRRNLEIFLLVEYEAAHFVLRTGRHIYNLTMPKI